MDDYISLAARLAREAPQAHILCPDAFTINNWGNLMREASRMLRSLGDELKRVTPTITCPRCQQRVHKLDNGVCGLCHTMEKKN